MAIVSRVTEQGSGFDFLNVRATVIDAGPPTPTGFDFLNVRATVIDAGPPTPTGFDFLGVRATVIDVGQPPGVNWDYLGIKKVEIKPPTNWLLIGGVILAAGTVTALAISLKK